MISNRRYCPWFLTFSLVACIATSLSVAEDTAAVKPIPRILGDYVHVYRPAGDVFPGPSTPPLEAGKHYDDWVVNDHCFVRDEQGQWHIFGITHPYSGLENVHAGEWQSFHAVAPKGPLKSALCAETWKDAPKVLPPAERPGEIPENHAPCI